MAKKKPDPQPTPLDARAVVKYQDRITNLLATVEEHNRLPSHINSFEVVIALGQFFDAREPFFYHLPSGERADQSIIKAHMNVIEALHHLCDWAKLPWPPKTDDDWNTSSRDLGPVPPLVVGLLKEALSLLPGQAKADDQPVSPEGKKLKGKRGRQKGRMPLTEKIHWEIYQSEWKNNTEMLRLPNAQKVADTLKRLIPGLEYEATNVTQARKQVRERIAEGDIPVEPA